MSIRWSDRGAAIVPFGNKIILMRRERGYGKKKNVYYTIPGGGKEIGETIRDTTIREIKEEIGIDIEIVSSFAFFNTARRKQYIFIGKYIKGKFGTGEGEEFVNNDYKANGAYIPELVSFEKLKKITLVPLNIKRMILKNYKQIISVQDKEAVEKIKKKEEEKKQKKKKTREKEIAKRRQKKEKNVNDIKKYGKKSINNVKK